MSRQFRRTARLFVLLPNSFNEAVARLTRDLTEPRTPPLPGDEVPRAIRPNLGELVEPTADLLDRPIVELLVSAGRGEDVTAALR